MSICDISIGFSSHAKFSVQHFQIDWPEIAWIQLDIRTKLCIRDSLYRLARSAEQRHNCANLIGGNGDDRDASRALMFQETNKYAITACSGSTFCFQCILYSCWLVLLRFFSLSKIINGEMSHISLDWEC